MRWFAVYSTALAMRELILSRGQGNAGETFPRCGIKSLNRRLPKEEKK